MKLFLKRLFAYWIDFILIAVILIFIQWLIYQATSGFPFDYLRKGIEIEVWVLLTMSLPVWAYFIGMEMYKQPIGKRMLRLVVMDQVGSQIKFRQALGRTFIRLLPWELTHVIILVPQPWWGLEEPENPYLILIPNIIWIMYIVVLFFNKGQKGIHDFFARTRVVER